MTATYDDFLATKALLDPPSGLADVPELSSHLFPFQRDIVTWALRRGRAAVFSDCGTGKTLMQLEWARVVSENVGPVLILAPLAVAKQTVHEGAKFGIKAGYSRDGEPRGLITTANYEMLEHFDPADFSGIVLDESSILKSYDGSTRTAIIEAFGRTPYRLACTATPAPNDFMELGNHSEFLGILTRPEMLATFFVHDGGETQQWRLKGHAEGDFWRWMCSWAVTMRRPSDLGYDDEGFVLPELRIHEVTVAVDRPTPGHLFALHAETLQERIAARRDTVEDRVSACVEIICEENESATGQGQLGSPGSLCGGPGHEGGRASGSQTLAGSESAEAESATASQVRDRSSRRGRTARAATGTVRDLRTLGHEQAKDLSGGGSLPLNGEGARDALPELQSGAGQVQRQPGSASRGSVVPQQKWLVWVNLNAEQDAVERALKARGISCVSIQGKTQDDDRERLEESWRRGDVQVMLTKPGCFGYGMNWQHCARVAFVGLSDSWESFYQALRRCWRFGQTKPVDVYVIAAETEGAVVANIKRKEEDAARLGDEMVTHMKDITAGTLHAQAVREQAAYNPDHASGNGWDLHCADCVEVIRKMPDASIDFSVFSPPFASLYTYSASDRDMGNCRDHATFFQHFGFATRELFRVLKPGRLISFHCMNLPTSKCRDGIIGITDFRGDLIRLFEKAGFVYHSEVCIWKDPVTAMQRTKALGLLYKQIKKDSAMSRQGIADYLVTMRKPGVNPEPVTHTPEDFPVTLWQRYASPVWMDINPSDTLQFRTAREHDDERHICALQLEVIRRAVLLWTNPNDLILSPFAGIGSEGYVALEQGRRFVGAELKRSYFDQARKNLDTAAREQAGLFAATEAATA